MVDHFRQRPELLTVYIEQPPAAASATTTKLRLYGELNFPGEMRLWPLGCIAALSVRAYRRKQLTPLGVATAIIVSSLYTVHPWGVFLVQLLTFYVTGTQLTKVQTTCLGADGSTNTISRKRLFRRVWMERRQGTRW
jgi:hypothetical protein